MENKYYVPDITEFHVGFEVSYINLGERVNHIIEENDLTLGNYEGVTELYEILKNEPLTKYLDKEDIESLGFELGGEQLLKNEHYTFKYSKYNIRIVKVHTTLYTIQKIRPNKKITLFQGYIKNKSELKKLLKQLNIT